MRLGPQLFVSSELVVYPIALLLACAGRGATEDWIGAGDSWSLFVLADLCTALALRSTTVGTGRGGITDSWYPVVDPCRLVA